MGKTHTVEIHPDIDHLYNVKNAVKEAGGKVHINNLKKNPKFSHIINKVPTDSKGFITPEGIDKHIESLPKKKVNITIGKYDQAIGQLHRQNSQQYIASIGLHPETLISMTPQERKHWDIIKGGQHNLSTTLGNSNSPEFKQMGWARIDPHRPQGNKWTANNNHWHIDEIQSDFQNNKKIKSFEAQSRSTDPVASSKEMHKVLSHEHDDPQHAVHSAVNALGRKLGIESMSLDTPKDQIVQSSLQVKRPGTREKRTAWTENDHKHFSKESAADDKVSDKYYHDTNKHRDENLKPEHIQKLIEASHDPHLKSAAEKIGHEGISEAFSAMGGSEPGEQTEVEMAAHDKWHTLTNEEQVSLGTFVRDKANEGPHYTDDIYDEVRNQHLKDLEYDPNYQLEGGKPLAPGEFDQEGFFHAIDKGQEGYSLEMHQGYIDHPNNSEAVKSALQKLGHKGVREAMNTISTNSDDYDWWNDDSDPDSVEHKFKNLSQEEQNAIWQISRQHMPHYEDYVGDEDSEDTKTPGVLPPPVHHVDTYEKRPKKLGYELADKKEILGDYPYDQHKQVQYSKLHKKLQDLYELLKKNGIEI